ncbi:hypothetical protein HBI56_216900 [Parastagonospora nodorum]|uniref:Uncharacterized protein n=1 Tax=Phaeosphaeria nodorum (strain SN15 / ATCC MYA-4574 / FGSC 10173) TaxID=321614 RepID=A0A7U2F3Y9_PHANO|nr:hypothetical protein HBH53_000250 [Parastagonospora nodorum]QRC96245.1 hypothetical protein JI435_408510 [Parastagonospora nodorum SN15]KAH4007486.1 hypothetical protein HBI10_009750 [Parastagonospora nodorum]KAH4023671.1 hypothetical protein HBI13_091460 [Parastagonospora nodorum]KAH4102628.1 hypothetical protein HBH46_126350 [Parastagonospora nodorum]
MNMTRIIRLCKTRHRCDQAPGEHGSRCAHESQFTNASEPVECELAKHTQAQTAVP